MSTRKNFDGEEVLEGHMGNLTPEQQVKIREFYTKFFELFERNPQVSADLDKRGGPNAASKDPPSKKDEKQAGKDIPKDDKAKEEAKKQEEMKEMNKFLDRYGGPYLRRAAWEFTKADFMDASVLRFLRARKWDVDRALAMLCAALCFRLDMDVEGIVRNGENGMKDVPGFLNQFRRGISYIRGNTQAPGEYPIYFIHVARHFTSAQKHEVLQQFVLLAMENARLLTTPPYEKAVIVFDMNGFGLKNMDWQCVLFLVRCLEAYYPESLQRIYVHGAPWIFRGIWQVLQPMLDPVVRDKIKFSSKAKDLEDYIPTTKLREGMGGTMDWDWDYTEPDPKENDLMKRTDISDEIRKEKKELEDKFEELTRKWCSKTEHDDDDADLTFQRLVLMKQIRLKQIQLNPYIRAVNVYQRQGILTEDNSHNWTYPQKGGAKTQSQRVGERHNIPALIKWLRDNGQDTMEDSYGGKYGACGTERSRDLKPVYAQSGDDKDAPAPKSSAPPKSDKRRQDAAAAGAAGAGAGAAAGAATQRAPASPQQEQPPRAAAASPQQQQQDEQPQSYTGAIVGAVTGAAAAVGATAAGAASYVTGRDNGEGQHEQQRSNGSAPAEEEEEDEEYDEDDDAAFDDEIGSEMSDESITPDTSVVPSYIPTKPIKASDVKISDNDCREDLGLVREAMSLFLNSRMKEAEEICLKGADHRMYKAEGMALINTVKSIMTFEPTDLETAIHSCKHAMNVASALRKKKGAVGKLLGGKKSALKDMTLVQQHAELVFAESQLLKCVLGIFYAGDAIAFVRQAFSLRSAYFLMRELYKFVEQADAAAEEASISGKRAPIVLDQDFRSGVYVGNGLCSLILSMLPKRALKMMEGFGFIGDRRWALDLFSRAGGWSKNKPLPSISADEEGVRRPLCDIAICVYHLIISAYIPITDVDFEFADKVLSWDLVRFPNGIFFLYFSARLYASQALPEKAIEYFRNAIESQREYKQLHHLCFWDLSLTYLSTCDFARAYECYDVLSRESNWSKAIYQYAKAVMLYETGMDDRAKSATVMRTVPKLVKKIAGRQIPFEKFVTLKAKKYVEQNNRLPLPGIEFSYIWHCMQQTPVFLLVENTLTRIDEFIDDLERYTDPNAYGNGASEYWSAYCLAFFLRGVALRFVAYPADHTVIRAPPDDAVGSHDEVVQDAVQSFQKVFQHGGKLDEVDRYLVYFAHYELGRLKDCMGDDAGARHEFKLVMSGKPLEAKGKGTLAGGAQASYLLSNMCQVRTHAALETMRIQRGRSKGSFFSDSGSLARGSSIGGSLSSRSISMSSRSSITPASSATSRSRGVSVGSSQ